MKTIFYAVSTLAVVILFFLAITWLADNMSKCVEYKTKYGWIGWSGTFNETGFDEEQAIRLANGRPISSIQVCTKRI